MAKKSSTSEINGFVSIKTDDANKTRQKVSARTSGAATNIKNNTSKSNKIELDDDIKSTKVISKDAIGNRPKRVNTVTKVVNKDAVGDKTKENSVTKVRNKDVVENKRKHESNVSKVINKDSVDYKAKRESSVIKVSQSNVNISTNVKTRQNVNATKTNPGSKSINEAPHKDYGLRGKSNPVASSNSLTTEPTSKRNAVADVSKSKRSTNPSEKGISRIGRKSTDKIQRVTSEDTKIKSVSKDSVNNERKKILDTGKTGAYKKTSPIKKTESNKTTEKNVTPSSRISTKTDNVLIKQNTVNRSISNSNQKDKIALSKVKPTNQSEPVISDIKVESSKNDAAVRSNYMDLMYFEVDMTDSKLPTNRVQSARVKSATSHPPSVTRQGTFTKDESPNHSESEAKLTNEDSNQENHLITQDNNEEVDYEDDFEDYESDFEEYVSESESESGLSTKSGTDSQQEEIKPVTKPEPEKALKSMQKVVEEERKLDSGNYDLSPKTVFPSFIKQKQLDLIKEAITQENISLFEKRKKITAPEEEKKEESKVVVLDFLSALKKTEHVQQAQKEKQRSSIILQMISLHEQKIDLFEGLFSDDDVFENIYQNKNVSHASSQTKPILNEEASQTNDILLQNKWTQYPISYHSWSNTSFSFIAFMEDQRGYGGDNLTIDYKSWWSTKYNAQKLYNFIDSASKVILVLLEEEARWRSSEKNMSIANPKDDLGFSDGCISMRTEKLIFLHERPICDILFSPHDSNIFVSSHRFSQDIEKLPSFTDQFFGRSILCVWNILQPSQPLYLLVASCQICAVTFDSEYDNFILAGLTDGSVCLWDLNESSIYHKESTAGSMEYLLRTPTFCTSHLAGKDYHQNVIVSMKSIGYESYGGSSSQKFNPTQIITLDTDGKVVLWIVTRTVSALERSDRGFDKVDYGISYWGKFKLVMGKTLNPDSILPESERKWGLQFLSMNLAPDFEYNGKKHTKSILVGTNIGKIIHFYNTEDEVDVPVFTNELGDNYAMSVMCLERNPHGFPLFLAGCNDGSIRFYVLDKPEPFKIISFDEDFVYTPIIKIRWSPIGLGLFYVLDKNFGLHFWDICKDGRSPQISVSLKPLQAAHFDVTCDDKFVYIALSVQRFKIDIHRVKEKFISTNSEEENEFFMKLVKINSDLYEESTSIDSLS